MFFSSILFYLDRTHAMFTMNADGIETCACDMETCSLKTDTGFLYPEYDEIIVDIMRFEMISLREYPRVSGFHGSCTALDAVLMADLTCLYNETCLHLLLRNYPNLPQVK